MNTRTVAIAFLVLVLPDMLGQAAPDAKESPSRADRTQRVRELIYGFRNYRVFCRDEEWAETIRELATIGKDAVPELVAELDRTDRDATLRSLAFSLRAIGDPRAVPALIRAIPKALRPPGSDCGVLIADRDLRAFMLAHQNHKAGQDSSVTSGRPVNEILSALERITNHREPPEVGDNDQLRLVFLEGTAALQAQQRAMFAERQGRWEAWWSKHRWEFVTPEELRSVEPAKRDEDLVEKAGIARYGMLFPTGGEGRLGPIRMLRLTRGVYANARSHLDLDTGRVLSQYEGIKLRSGEDPDGVATRSNAWYQQNGIDIRCFGLIDGLDLQLWQIDDSRWDTLETEIRNVGPLTLGREATSYLVRFDKSPTNLKFGETATFLFITRAGGRGIIQVFPKDPDADRYRVRYRMWLTAQTVPDARPVAERSRVKPPGTSLGKTVTITLERPSARAFLLDLETGRKVVPPEKFVAHAFEKEFSRSGNDEFGRWYREQGIDVFGDLTAAEAMGPDGRSSLVGLDMVTARILPLSFDELTVEETREILERAWAGRLRTARMTIDTELAERPDTFAFQTRDGTVGLLQMEAAGNQAGKMTLRYRIERRD